MGTRNLTCVVLDGEYKVAQYGQWDGYPSGQGITALHFLRDEMIRPLFEERVRALSWVTEEDRKAEWVECGADPDSTWVTLDVSDRHKELYPHNSRDTGAGILALIQESRVPLKLVSALDFAGDSISNEWTWVVDLDQDTFEGYEGFVKYPHEGERFSDFEPYTAHDGTIYYPVRHVATFDLNDLPTDDQFLAAFKGDED